MTPPPEPDDVSARLAAFAATLQRADVAPDAREVARTCLLDFIGLCAYASRNAESNSAVLSGLDWLGESGESGDPDGTVVIGFERPRRPHIAALLNGLFAHSFDFDDTNADATLHPGAAVLPAVLASAELSRASGCDVVTAICAGYEVSCRVGAALGPTAYDRGFHPTSVAGIFGAVAGGARALGLSPEQTAASFGLAGSMAAGSMQYLDNGSWNKRMHPGWAAHSAIMALGWARAGFRATSRAIEGQYGLLHAHSDGADASLLDAGLGEQWRMISTGIKPYPSCRYTHGAIDAARELRQRLDGQRDPTADLAVTVSPYAHQIVGERTARKLRPLNSVDAQFSIFFQVAAALLDGQVSLSTYDRLDRPDLHSIIDRTTVDVDDRLPAIGARLAYRPPADDEVVIECRAPVGEPPNELGYADVEAKFHALAAACFGVEHRKRIVAAVAGLDNTESVNTLVGQLRGG